MSQTCRRFFLFRVVFWSVLSFSSPQNSANFAGQNASLTSLPSTPVQSVGPPAYSTGPHHQFSNNNLRDDIDEVRVHDDDVIMNSNKDVAGKKDNLDDEGYVAYYSSQQTRHYTRTTVQYSADVDTSLTTLAQRNINTKKSLYTRKMRVKIFQTHSL